MQFRRFNDRGIEAFRTLLMDMRTNPKTPFPHGMLIDESLTEVLEPNISATVDEFSNRMAFAEWLSSASIRCNAQPPRSDVGFWAWLTAALFDQVCPVDGHGKRKVRAEARYIPDLIDFRLQYRHLLFGSYNIYNLHRSNPSFADVLLQAKMHQLNHFFYQLASRRELVSNPMIMKTASSLYFDESGKRKPGGTTYGKSGSVFRYVRYLNQLDRVFDLGAIGQQGLMELLPHEFDKFKTIS